MIDTLRRLPLAARLLLGLLANVLLVAAVLAVVLLTQIRLNPSWLLSGPGGNRVHALASDLQRDLNLIATNDLPNLLDQYRQSTGLDLYVFNAESTALGSPPPTPLPQPVLDLLRPSRGPPFARGNRSGLGLGPGGGGGGGGGQSGGRGPGGGFGPRGLPSRAALGPGPFPRAIIRAGQPPAFWIVVQLPFQHTTDPAFLLLRARHPWSGGLLLDIRPWALAGLATLAISVAFWLPYLRGITRDLARLSRQTETIAAGRFDDRLTLRRQDELGRLAQAINRMAERLAQQVAGQRRFLGDAAHELASPIARMQTAVAILDAHPATANNPTLHDLAEDLDEMAALVQELLAFSRATHGRPAHLEPVPVHLILQRAWSRESQPHTSLINELPSNLAVLADAALLQRAIANVLRNAVRYAGHAGPLRAHADIGPSQAALHLDDQGPGVSPEALPRLFEPFFRPEDSRSRDAGGAGLGLAIVKTCLDACQGTVEARNLNPSGFRITLRLPLAPSLPP